MRSKLLWTDKIQSPIGTKLPIYALAFSPSQSHLILSAGSDLLLYDTNEGELLQTLKAHKDSILSLCYSFDGKKIVTGGADKLVVIWSWKGEGLLKYTHSDGVGAVAFNPVTGGIVSGAGSDFGIWSTDQKSVAKFKVRILFFFFISSPSSLSFPVQFFYFLPMSSCSFLDEKSRTILKKKGKEFISKRKMTY